MREILFKAKRLDNGEWVEGYYIEQQNLDYTYKIVVVKPPLVQILSMKGIYHVDPKTICQYTGLTDKNGKKIFEGDYVHCEEENETMEVKHDDYSKGYHIGDSYVIGEFDENELELTVKNIND